MDEVLFLGFKVAMIQTKILQYILCNSVEIVSCGVAAGERCEVMICKISGGMVRSYNIQNALDPRLSFWESSRRMSGERVFYVACSANEVCFCKYEYYYGTVLIY